MKGKNYGRDDRRRAPKDTSNYRSTEPRSSTPRWKSGDEAPKNRTEQERNFQDKPFQSNARDNNRFSDRKRFDRDNKPYGNNADNSRNDNFRADRPAFKSNRPGFDSDRPKFRSDKPSSDRPAYRSFNNRDDKPNFRTERNNNDRPAFRTDRPNFNSDRPAFNKDRRDENRDTDRDRPRFNTDRNSGDRSYGRNEGRSSNRNEGRRSYGNNEGARYNDKPRAFRSNDNNRNTDDNNRFERNSRGSNENSRFYNRYERDNKSFQNNDDFHKPKQVDMNAAYENVVKKSQFQNHFHKWEQDDLYDAPKTGKNALKQSEFPMRLNRFIANSGVCSRRKADELILQGQITVNGQTVTEMGFKVNPEDTITYNGKNLQREKMVYILLNKPKDFITTMEDPQDRKTVMNLVKSATQERIYPVGRLDRNTTGLLLLTNDGDLSMKLTHPSNGIRKIYQVKLDKPLSRNDMIKIAEGVELEDGIAEVDQIAFVNGEDKREIGVELHSGKNRIVRRIFESLQYQVDKLDRVFYAGLTKKDLPRGHYRFLSDKEVRLLKAKGHII